jgi:hypothetical protein
MLDAEDYTASLEEDNKNLSELNLTLGVLNLDLGDRLAKYAAAIRWILGDSVKDAIEQATGVVVDHSDGEDIFKQALLGDRDTFPAPPEVTDVIDGAFGIERNPNACKSS